MKKLIEWNKSLSVHMPDIDEQHKKWVGLVEETYELSLQNKIDKKVLGNLIKEFVEFTRIHFSTEEIYFRRWNYPFAAEHEREHAELIQKVLRFNDEFKSRGIEIIPEMIRFLKDWLENHLKIHDLKYRDYFIRNKYIK